MDVKVAEEEPGPHALRGGVWRCTVYVLYDCTVYVMYELYTVQTRYRGGVTMRVCCMAVWEAGSNSACTCIT